jgi:hypothetical protein
MVCDREPTHSPGMRNRCLRRKQMLKKMLKDINMLL